MSSVRSNKAFKSDLFWKPFLTEVWEKKPLIVKNAYEEAGIKIDPSMVFESLLQIAKHIKSGKEVMLRAWVNGNPYETAKELSQFFPSRDDCSMDGYRKRMEQAKRVQFGFTINRFHSYDPTFWKYLCLALDPFLKNVGFPNSKMEAVLFMGNYDATPFGVHLDKFTGGLMFPVVGSKSIRTWTSTYVRKHPDLNEAQEYSRHLRNSSLLKAPAGGMLYWPSDRWHVGESSRQFSIAISLPNYFLDKASGQDFIAKITMEELGKRFLKQNELVYPPSTPKKRRLNSDFQRMFNKDLTDFNNVINSPNLRQRLLEEWIKKVSAHGFREAPFVAKERELTLNDLIQGDSVFPFIWIPSINKKGQLTVSCRGQCANINNSPFVPKLLSALNSNKEYRVNELTAEFSSKNYGPKKVLKLLHQLQGLGGIEILSQ